MDIGLMVRRYLAIRSAHMGAPGPGGCIYYLSDVSGVMGLWNACRRAGRTIHDIAVPWERRIGGYRLSPSGEIVFASDFDGDERWALYYVGEELRRVAGEDGSMNLLGAWDRAGRRFAFTGNARNGVDFDLYVYDVGEGSVSLVAELEGINRVSAWLDDEHVLIVKSNSNLDTDILAVSVKGEARNLTRHEGEALNIEPVPVSPTRFLYATNTGREFLSLAIYDTSTGKWKVVFEPGWDVEMVRGGGRRVFIAVNEDGESLVYSVDPDSLNVQLFYRPGGTVTWIEPLPGGEGAVVSVSSPVHGNEVFIARLDGAERLTWMPKAGLGEESFVYPEKFSYESFDGLRIHGLLYRPRRPVTDPPPAVVWLHGGPESQERVRFNQLIQALVGLGIAVAAPNYRGSWGYGKTFVHLDDVEKRMGAVHDVYRMVRYLAAEGVIDPTRVCVMGGSYGGYLTLMSLAIYPEAWRCGVEIVGIFNLVTFIKNTSPYRRRYRMAEYGDPDKHYDVMMELSPITHADKIRAPLMVIHGARDPRVPVSEAEQLVETLRSKGVPVEYIRLEDEGHGIARVENRLRVYTRMLEFVYKHLV